jgi:hypothetical protein
MNNNIISNHLFYEFSGLLVTVSTVVITVLTLYRGCASLPVSRVAQNVRVNYSHNATKVSGQGTL